MTEEQGEREQAAFGDEHEVAREEAAAAGEAASIGGRRDEVVDEAERPVSEAGGGEAEGFELSEQELIDEAEQAGRHNPMTEAGEPEETGSSAAYGEPDQLGSTERDDEPADDAESP